MLKNLTCKEEKELYQTFNKLKYDYWPNFVLLEGGYWFICLEREEEIKEGFIEFHLASRENWDIEMMSSGFDQKKCLNIDDFRNLVSINKNKIISIHQFRS
jgi:hypothetical protein